MKLISLLLPLNYFFNPYETNLSTQNDTFVVWIVWFMNHLCKPIEKIIPKLINERKHHS